MSISRRGFLTGTVAAAIGSELIVKADAADILQFATNKSVNVGEVQNLVANVQHRDYSYTMITPASKGDVLYNKFGQPVGIVESTELFRRFSKGRNERMVESPDFFYNIHQKPPIRISCYAELIWTDDFNNSVPNGVEKEPRPRW